MKFVIERDALLSALQMVSGIVERRQTMPILSNVLLELNGNRLKFTTTDLEIQVEVSGEVIESDRDGSFTVPARKLVDLCRALTPESSITIEVIDSKAVVTSGRSRYALQVLPAGEYPTIETKACDTEFSVQQTTLGFMFEKTAFAMAQQDVRYYLNGMLLELSKDRIKTVATDGHRMSVTEQAVEVGELADGAKLVQIILPRKTVNELSRLMSSETDEMARISIGRDHISVNLDGLVLTSKLIDASYPDYNRVIPRNSEYSAICDREQLREALSRAAILSNEKLRSVRLVFDGSALEVEARNREHEQAEEYVEIQYDGPKIEIGFNVNYLLDALGASEAENVEIQMSGAGSSSLLVFSDLPDSQFVVMPMRL